MNNAAAPGHRIVTFGRTVLVFAGRTVALSLGLSLLVLAWLDAGSFDFLLAAHRSVVLKFPQILHRPVTISIWWPLAGLSVALLAAVLAQPAGRRVLASVWRSPAQIARAGAVLVLFGLTVFPWDSSELPFHSTGSRPVFYQALAGSGLALILAAAYPWLRFPGKWVGAAWRWLCGLKPAAFALLVFGFVLLAANIVSWLGYGHLPHVSDSCAQLFQARVFATGHCHLPSPQFPDFFDRSGIINDGRWYAQYPFLHSLMLVPGVLAGVPWLVNPLLGALAVALVYVLGREVFDERTGRAAALLGSASPFIITMSAEFMNHATALLFATFSLLFWFRHARHGRWHQALLAGLFLGLVADVRPFTAFALCLPLIGCMVWRAVRTPDHRLTGPLLFLIGAASLAALDFGYNWLTSGGPLSFGYIVLHGPGHMIGFHTDPSGMAHTPWRGVVNTGYELNYLNQALFEWGLPSLLPMALLFVMPARDRRDWLLVSLFGILVVAHFFYWAHGARFYYESLAGVLLLSAHGLIVIPGSLGHTAVSARSDESGLVARALPLALIIMLAIGLPPVLRQCHEQSFVNTNILDTVRRSGIRNAVVFCGRYADVFSANRFRCPENWHSDGPPPADQILVGDIVYARDNGFLNPVLTLAFPGRTYYTADRGRINPLEEQSFAGSRVEATLTQFAELLHRAPIYQYKTVIWPFPEILPAALWDAAPDVVITDCRSLSTEIFEGRSSFAGYLPALCFWLRDDPRLHLSGFSVMDGLSSCTANGVVFTLLATTEDSLGAVYDIRPAP